MGCGVVDEPFYGIKKVCDLNQIWNKVFFFFLLFPGSLNVYAQVYVDPNAPVAVVQPSAVPPPAANLDLITQTVYGFLDFTTTIGNTVMVFSPQSAAVPTGK